MRPDSTAVEVEVLHPSRDGHEPTRALWTAVIVQSAEDRVSRSPTKARRLAAEDAVAWLQSDEEDVGSFRWVCDALGLDVESTRRWALNVTREELKSFRTFSAWSGS